VALTTKPSNDKRITSSNDERVTSSNDELLRSSAITSRLPVEVSDNNVPELIKGARSGLNSAWTAIVAHYAPALEAFATSKGSSDPAGIASTCLLELARSIGTFRGNDKRSLDAYIYRTARNRIIDA